MESPLAFLAGEREKNSGPVSRTLTLALFDLDGTLIDSEENHYKSDEILLARRGISFSRRTRPPTWGRTSTRWSGASG
jgi:beta-phosphoglucomutase-like phosphatase (HAD superfamily)